jgi:hypothetical protein
MNSPRFPYKQSEHRCVFAAAIRSLLERCKNASALAATLSKNLKK